MEVPAGDERTTTLLLSKYRSSGCFYCLERLKKKKTDHTHHNCPNRPCYLCKKVGHVINACPYRMKPNAHESEETKPSQSCDKRSRPYHFLRAREIEVLSDRIHPSLLNLQNAQFDCKAAFIGRKLHEKRITAVEWIPGTGTRILSGDKAGVLNLWNIGDSMQNGWLDVDKMPRLKPVTTHPHHCNINQIVLHPGNLDVVYTSSSDGLACRIALSRMDQEQHEVIQNLNPQGWQGKMSLFKMMYGLRYHQERQCLFAGVSDGTILSFDPREGLKPNVRARFHKDKVTCIDINPISCQLLVTASNDKYVRLWDIRKFIPGHEIGSYTHGGVVSAAYFSPNTGAKLLTTSFDNKLQVWNDLHAFQGDVNEYPDAAPVEIIHSHNFHRHLNPFRAAWDPKDWRDDLFVCGRYLGDAYYNEGQSEEATVLHPIDMFSAKTGSVVHSIVDSAMPLICPLNKCAPNADCVLTAVSHDLVIWSPPPKGFHDGTKMKRISGRKGARGDGGEGNDDDDGNDGDDTKRKKRKKVTRTTVKTRGRSVKRKTVS